MSIEYSTIIRNQSDVNKFLYKLQKFGLSPIYKLTPKRYPIIAWWENGRYVKFRYMSKQKIYVLCSDNPEDLKYHFIQNGFEIISLLMPIKAAINTMMQQSGVPTEVNHYGLYENYDAPTLFGNTYGGLIKEFCKIVTPYMRFLILAEKIKQTDKNVLVIDVTNKNEYDHLKDTYNAKFILHVDSFTPPNKLFYHMNVNSKEDIDWFCEL